MPKTIPLFFAFLFFIAPALWLLQNPTDEKVFVAFYLLSFGSIYYFIAFYYNKSTLVRKIIDDIF